MTRRKKGRDYAAEYRQRLHRAFVQGLSKAQARGHARPARGEQPISKLRRTSTQGGPPRQKKRLTVDQFVQAMTGRGATRHEAYTLWFSP